MIIDSIARRNSLVKKHPFLASLADALCEFLTQVVSLTAEFHNAGGQNLGRLEQGLKKPSGGFAAKVMEKAAQQKAGQTPSKCPECGRKLTRRQKLERAIHTGQGGIKVTRVRGWCGKCQQWFCPGDEALGVESGYSPCVQEMAALFASKMPLAEASAVLERAAGIRLAPTTLDRVAKQTAQKGPGTQTLALGLDGHGLRPGTEGQKRGPPGHHAPGLRGHAGRPGSAARATPRRSAAAGAGPGGARGGDGRRSGLDLEPGEGPLQRSRATDRPLPHQATSMDGGQGTAPEIRPRPPCGCAR